MTTPPPPTYVWERPVNECWPTFSSSVWKQATLRCTVAPQLNIPEDHLFALALRAAASVRSGVNSVVRVYVAQTAVISDLRSYMPTADDEGFDQYVKRMRQMVGNQPFLIVFNHLQTLDPDLWSRAAAFLDGLYAHTGEMPIDEVDYDMFVGEYDMTPFGVHFDDSANFMTVPVGKKRMIVWPDNERSVPMHTLRYEHCRQSGEWLDCSPGEMVFWPGFRQHVGESRDGPSVSVNLAMYMKSRYIDDVLALLEQQIAQRVPDIYDGGVYGFPDSPGRLPGKWDAVSAATIGFEHALDSALLEMWLKKLTSRGFVFLPEPVASASAISRADLVQLREHSRVIWSPHLGMLVANGYAASINPAVGPVLADVLSDPSQPTTLLELANAVPRDTMSPGQLANDLIGAARLLVQWRAVEIIKPKVPLLT